MNGVLCCNVFEKREENRFPYELIRLQLVSNIGTKELDPAIGRVHSICTQCNDVEQKIWPCSFNCLNCRLIQ